MGMGISKYVQIVEKLYMYPRMILKYVQSVEMLFFTLMEETERKLSDG